MEGTPLLRKKSEKANSGTLLDRIDFILSPNCVCINEKKPGKIYNTSYLQHIR